VKLRINLSIGLGCVSSITNRTIHTKLRGKHDALYIMTKVNGTRYEFIFGLSIVFVVENSVQSQTIVTIITDQEKD
jgi:hypothetical protein